MSEMAEVTNGALVPKQSVPMGKLGVQLTDIGALWRFSDMVFQSGMAPKGMNIQAIAVSIQMGLEVGLSPLQALQSTAVINGRPGIYGDAAKALVEASGLLEEFDEWFEVDNKRVDRLPAKLTDTVAAVCSSKRKGRKPRVSIFTVADAKAAALWGKQGPWSQYPQRMLMFRARGFNLRDNFGDVLKGLRTVEELRDSPDVIDAVATPVVTPTVEPPAGSTKTDQLAAKLRSRAASVEPEVSLENAAELANTMRTVIKSCEDADQLNAWIGTSGNDFKRLRKMDGTLYLSIEDEITERREFFAARDEPKSELFEPATASDERR